MTQCNSCGGDCEKSGCERGDIVEHDVFIDCRVCQYYCETNGCEMDDCDKGSDFSKSATLRLWEYQT